MKNPVSVLSVVGTVTGVALFGMLMGAAFGWAAGSLAPSFFQHIVPWNDVEPIGFAVVLGAFGGVLSGAALGGFAVLLHGVFAWRSGAKDA